MTADTEAIALRANSATPGPANLEQIKRRNAEWLAEMPGGPPWTERQRGEAFFQAGYDRYVLLAALRDAASLAADIPELLARVRDAEAARDEAQMEYADCWPEGDRLRARVAELENDKRRLVYVQTGSYHMAPWVHEMWPEWAGEWEARINAERTASPVPEPKP